VDVGVARARHLLDEELHVDLKERVDVAAGGVAPERLEAGPDDRSVRHAGERERGTRIAPARVSLERALDRAPPCIARGNEGPVDIEEEHRRAHARHGSVAFAAARARLADWADRDHAGASIARPLLKNQRDAWYAFARSSFERCP